MLAAEGYAQVLRIMPKNAVARVNFASTLDKAGMQSLAVTHLAEVIDATNVDGRTQATARHRYGVLQLSEGTVMCTDKSARYPLCSEKHAQCLIDKQSALEKGVEYLMMLQTQAARDDNDILAVAEGAEDERERAAVQVRKRPFTANFD